jgi:hypothetical protein
MVEFDIEYNHDKLLNRVKDNDQFDTYFFNIESNNRLKTKEIINNVNNDGLLRKWDSTHV